MGGMLSGDTGQNKPVPGRGHGQNGREVLPIELDEVGGRSAFGRQRPIGGDESSREVSPITPMCQGRLGFSGVTFPWTRCPDRPQTLEWSLVRILAQQIPPSSERK